MSDAVSCSSSQKKAQKKGVDIESNGCSKPAGLQISGEEDFTFAVIGMMLVCHLQSITELL